MKISVLTAAHQELTARELLDIDVANTYLVLEHEYSPPACIQDNTLLAPILEGSIYFDERKHYICTPWVNAEL